MTSLSRRGGRLRPLRSLLSLAAATAIATAGLAAVTVAPAAAAKTSTTFSTSAAATIKNDLSTTFVPIAVTGQHSLVGMKIAVTIDHPCDKELSLDLAAPSGNYSYVFLQDKAACAAGSITYTFVSDTTQAPGTLGSSQSTTNTYLPYEDPATYFGDIDTEGTWNIRIRDNYINDNAGTLTSASLTFYDGTDSTTPPAASITSGPAQGSVSGPDVTFTFTAPGTDYDGFQCRLVAGYLDRPSAKRAAAPGNSKWFGCSSPAYFELPPNGYTFGVRTIRDDGTNGPETYRDFSVGDAPVVDEGDSGGPNVTITSGPADGATVDTAPTYGFTTPADDFAGYECSLDGYYLASCPNPITLTDVAPGRHVFGVRGVDADGNRGDLTTRTFVLSAPAPSQACTDAQEAYDAAAATVTRLQERIADAKAQGKRAKVKRLKAKLAAAIAQRDAAQSQVDADC